MQHTHQYARKKRQLHNLSRKLHGLVMARQGQANDEIRKLVIRIKRLVAELHHLISAAELKKILGATAFLMGITFANQATAQSFAQPQTNPFGLISTYYHAVPAFADLDNDGDLDLLVGEYYGALKYFQNTGSADNPQFAAPLLNPFGLSSTNYLAFPEFADLDGDGDMDLLVGEYYGNMKYFQNTGTADNPQFEGPSLNPFGLLPTVNHAIPEFADLDNDGDLDLLVGAYYGTFQYFQNTGSAENPSFATPQFNPFGLSPTDLISSPAITDLDEDGDLDLLVGEYYGGLQYFENTGTPGNPLFALPQQNPFGLVPTYYFAFPAFADLDGDGDMDLLVGEYYGAMKYYENTGTSGLHDRPQMHAFEVFPNPVADELNFRAGHPVESIEVFDLTGVSVRTFTSPAEQLMVGSLGPGMYVLKVTFRDGSAARSKIQKI